MTSGLFFCFIDLRKGSIIVCLPHDRCSRATARKMVHKNIVNSDIRWEPMYSKYQGAHPGCLPTQRLPLGFHVTNCKSSEMAFVDCINEAATPNQALSETFTMSRVQSYLKFEQQIRNSGHWALMLTAHVILMGR